MQDTPPATSPHDPSQTHVDNKRSHVQNAIPMDWQDQPVLAEDSSVDLQSVHPKYRDTGTIMQATLVALKNLMKQVQVQQSTDTAEA